jgi:hypothetical protein
LHSVVVKEHSVIRFTLVVAFLVSLIAGAMPVAAQGTSTGNPGVGEAGTIYGSNGEPAGEVSVTEITDPFTEYDPTSSPPARGYHWAMIVVSLTAGNQPMTVNYSGFQMTDSDGFVSYQGYVYRSQESMDAQPDLGASELEAGQSASGAIFVQVFGDSTIALIEYSPSYEQSFVVADLRDEAVAPGDAVQWVDGAGSPLGELSVAGVLDPMEDFDSSSPPNRGFRFVGVAISFTNLGSRPASIDQYRFSVVDHEGFVTSSSGVYRTQQATAALPDLYFPEVAPGAQVSGLVSFQLLNGASIKDVIFVPQGDRKLRLAEYGENDTFEPPAITPVPTVAADPSCDAVIAWAQEATAAFAPLNSSFELLDRVSSGTEVDPQELEDAADSFDQVASDLEALDTPEAAQATSDQFADALGAIAEGFRTLAGDVEADNTANVTADVSAIYEQAFSLTGGAYSELAAKCPGIDDI